MCCATSLGRARTVDTTVDTDARKQLYKRNSKLVELASLINILQRLTEPYCTALTVGRSIAADADYFVMGVPEKKNFASKCHISFVMELRLCPSPW